MRIPLSWIRDFTPVDAPVEEIVDALNQLGLEVESVEQPGQDVSGVLAARVLEVLPHPEADRLVLVDIEAGSGTTRVVCGAKNFVAGDVVPYAPPGARLPEPFGLIEAKKLRGVLSPGMLLAPDELGLGEDHAGILHLDPAVEPGSDVREVLGLDDVIFDLDITPNRPDAMCVTGVARELAAHFRLPFDVPEPKPATSKAVAADVSVVIEAPDGCPRYTAWVAQVALGPSPGWLAQRLVKAGMRPISNVVDVTNYVMLERNQPLHAFDLDRLAGPGIVVRRAVAGERMTTLDDVDRELAPEDLLICDAQRVPQGLAGVMGGSTSEVSDATTAILLEAAYFERMGIARTSRRLKLRSEASARFERGMDPEAVARHSARAMELLVEVAGAKVAPAPIDEHPQPVTPAPIRLRPSRVNAVLGTDLTDREVVDALEPLGIATAPSGDALTATPPSWRPDLEREIDLVEEVGRRIGFERIGRTLPDTKGQIGALTDRQRVRRRVADALVGAGLSEAVTVPLVAEADLERAGAPLDRLVRAANPLRAEESVMRTRILPGLLRTVAYNRSHGLTDVALFEIGHVFLAPVGNDGVLPDEPEHVAVAFAGQVRRRPVEDDRMVDVFDAVDAISAVADGAGLRELRFEPGVRPGLHPGRSGAVVADGRELGVLGEVDDEVLAELGLEGPVVVAELVLDEIAAAPRRVRSFQPPSRYPASAIDLAFVVDDSIGAGAVADTLTLTAGPLTEDVRLFDVFRADALGAGRKSLAFGLRLRAPDHTLTDQEVAEIRGRCIDAVSKTHGAELRG